MEDIYKYRYNCVNVTAGSDQYIEQWTTNQTLDRRVVMAINPFIPNSLYRQYTDTQYQWCGPFVLMAENFARISKLRVQLTSAIIMENYQQIYKEKGMAGLPHILLMPLLASLLLRFINKESEHLVRIAKFYTFAYPDRILARTIIAGDHPFRQFQCFEPEVYYAIGVSICVISMVISAQKCSLKSLLVTIWSYLSVILSDYYAVPIGRAVERQLTGLWLISCVILLAAFSGELRDQVIKGRPIYWVDSIDDLYHWQHITKLQIIKTTDISNFINNMKHTNPMANDFSRRNVVEYWPNGTTLEDTVDYEGVKKGYTALVYPAHYIQIFKTMMISDQFREDIDFHVSENNGYSTPLFTVTNRANLEEKYAQLWDRVQENFVESGIHDYWFKVGLNPRRVGPDQGEKIVYRTHDFDNITIAQLSGMFMFLVAVEMLSLPIYSIEMYSSNIKKVLKIN